MKISHFKTKGTDIVTVNILCRPTNKTSDKINTLLKINSQHKSVNCKSKLHCHSFNHEKARIRGLCVKIRFI